MLLRVTPYDDPVVQALEAGVQAEYVLRYGGPDRTPMAPETFAPPAGIFLVGWDGDVPVACGGYRQHGPDAEIKRMYVPGEHRRRGYAVQVLVALEDAARAAGYPRIILETGTAQPEAIALYTANGYLAIPSFGLYRDSPQNRCFAKAL